MTIDRDNMGIYMLKCSANKKFYIGSSINLYDRMHVHLSAFRKNYHENKRMQNAYNKYGKENFSFSILEKVDCEYDLIKKEQHWIDLLKPAYNIRKIARSNLGMKASISTKKKLSEYHKNNPTETAFKKGQKAWNKGLNMPCSEELKLKISKANSGKKFSQEHKNKISEALKKYVKTDEHRRKLSLSKIGKPSYVRTEKHKQNLKDKLTGRIFTDEQKMNMRLGQKKRWDKYRNKKFQQLEMF